VLAVGPIVMMRAVAEMTRKENIHTVVSLNPIMIDGTGMCGGCRVLIDGKSEFACVDGPEFDAHKVNFEVLVQRNGMYREAEQRSLADYQRVSAEKTAPHDEEIPAEIKVPQIQESCAIAQRSEP
jgi:ferredoxin/flavodoxin---NADP+ reductase